MALAPLYVMLKNGEECSHAVMAYNILLNYTPLSVYVYT